MRTFCFEINEGLVALVGTGGSQEWLVAPSMDDMTPCVDSEEWKLSMEASISMGMLNSSPYSNNNFNNSVNELGSSSSPFSDSGASPEHLSLTSTQTNADVANVVKDFSSQQQQHQENKNQNKEKTQERKS